MAAHLVENLLGARKVSYHGFFDPSLSVKDCQCAEAFHYDFSAVHTACSDLYCCALLHSALLCQVLVFPLWPSILASNAWLKNLQLVVGEKSWLKIPWLFSFRDNSGV